MQDMTTCRHLAFSSSTEHANIADDWFQEAPVEDPWMGPLALVPKDWPSWS